jgi:hypothetical protein
MTFQTITLRVPNTVYQRAKRTAEALQRPVDKTIIDTLRVALPALDDVPLEMTNDLAAMSTFSDETLWEIARSVMPVKSQTRLRALATAQRERSLTRTKLQKLDELRREYGRITLRKAHAYSLLRERGLYSHAN